MPRYVAFLRAVNVGGRIVKMEELKKLFEAMGFDDVSTFIASGNVLFSSKSKDAAKLEAKIEKELHKSLGYAVETFVRGPEELAAAAAFRPFEDMDGEGFTLHVVFLRSSPESASCKAIDGLGNPLNAFRVEGRELYWLCRTKFNESGVSPSKFDKAVGSPATARNINTVRKLAAKLNPG